MKKPYNHINEQENREEDCLSYIVVFMISLNVQVILNSKCYNLPVWLCTTERFAPGHPRLIPCPLGSDIKSPGQTPVKFVCTVMIR